MDKTLGYLRESMSNYSDSDVCQTIYKKMLAKNYSDEEEFVKELNDEEMDFLDHVLGKEIKYAQDEQDDQRSRELNEVYELLF
ncbi:sigma-G-dependent sporulation-specific acid-soluble spore protein CsgA [Bacillus gobiensis]|uniref:sigma-G-dependent sporulation-specific acid-soluble spore protein CsgA n=1 Tax=Bacillus gobiensis TaxID=1441095 RepID=UPI003D195E9F